MKKKVVAIIIWVVTAVIAVTAGILALTEECSHEWNDWQIRTEANCTEDGEEYRICARCETEETRKVEAKGHTAGAAEVERAATCTEKGKSVTKCKVCSAQIATKEISALGHNYKKIDGESIEATCTVAGKIVEKCSRCNDVNTETIAATGHVEGDPVEIQPSCAKAGKIVVSCTVCQEAIEETPIEKLAHTWSDVAAQAATCSSIGWNDHKACTVCGEKENYEPILPHYSTTASLEAKIPTDCVTSGYEAGLVCAVCNTLLEGGKEIKAGHLLEGSWTTVTEATCYSYGWEEQACGRCGAVQGRDIPKQAHLYETLVEAVAATCTSTGVKEHKACKYCGAAETDFVLPMLSHKFDNNGICEACKTSTYEFVLNNDGTGYLLAGIKRSGENDTRDTFEVPGTYEGKVVVGIARKAFENSTYIKKLVLPVFVTEIGKDAFANSAIEEINLENVVTIAESAFEGCKSLKAIAFEDLTTLGDDAFYGCSALTEVKLPATLTQIEVSVFGGCDSIVSITVPYLGATVAENGEFAYIFGGKAAVPASLKEITVLETNGVVSAKAFEGLAYVKSIVFEKKVTQIGEKAFAGCAALESIKNGSGSESLEVNNFKDVTKIGALAFEGVKFAKVTLPFLGSEANDWENATIGYAFGSNVNLTDVTLLKADSLEAYAFANSEKLFIVKLPATVTEIGEYAFADCGALTSLKIGNNAENCIPTTVMTIGKSAFTGTKFESLAIPFIGNGLNETTFDYIFGGNENVPASLKKVTLLAGSVIAAEAFKGCATIETIVLPDTVTTIGAAAFSGCKALKEVNYNKVENEVLTTVVNELSAKVTKIGANAFSDTAIEKFTIPANVTSIGSNVFSGNETIAELTVPFLGSKITSEEVFGYLFAGNENVPASLKTVEILGGTKVVAQAFKDCATIEKVVLPESVTAIEANAFEGCAKLEALYIPDTVKSIGDYAFANCVTLKKVKDGAANELSISVKSIGAYAFSGAALEEFILPENVNTIGENVFEGNNKLQQLTVPFIGSKIDSAETFGYFFGGNEKIPATLKTVTVLGGTVLADEAFKGCATLQEINLPDGLIKIGEKAFAGCEGLSEMIVPDSVKYIRAGAFEGCSNLSKITLPFVGLSDGSVDENGNRVLVTQLHFGYIFKGDSTIGTQGKYIPASLTEVVLTKATRINDSAFQGCINLETVWIPSTLGATGLGAYAFKDCTGLKYVNFYLVEGSKWELNTIGDGAFQGCSSLESSTGKTSLVIPANVETIAYVAFNGCSKLVGITTEGQEALNVSTIGSNAFQGAFAQNVELNLTGVNNFGAYSFINSKIKSVTISGTLKEIKVAAFKDAKYLTTVVISTTVTTIGSEAFYGCVKLEKFADNENSGNGYSAPNVSYLGDRAFYNCTALKGAVVFESAVSVKNSAFANCSGLTEIVFNARKGESTIGENAFTGCSNVEWVFLYYNETSLLGNLKGTGVVTIDRYAFNGCGPEGELNIYVELIPSDDMNGTWNPANSDPAGWNPNWYLGASLPKDQAPIRGTYAEYQAAKAQA